MNADRNGFDERVYGVVHALVVGVEDPDGLGRVKVTFPWFNATYEEWARVAQTYAGDGFGSTWIPEEKAEVLVAFAHGDVRLPYVVGCLHSAVDPPPYVRDAGTDVKALRTPAGSELAFDETAGTIRLTTPSGARIELEEQPGRITITAADSLVLKANTVRIEGSDSVVVRGRSIALN